MKLYTGRCAHGVNHTELQVLTQEVGLDQIVSSSSLWVSDLASNLAEIRTHNLEWAVR